MRYVRKIEAQVKKLLSYKKLCSLFQIENVTPKNYRSD